VRRVFKMSDDLTGAFVMVRGVRWDKGNENSELQGSCPVHAGP